MLGLGLSLGLGSFNVSSGPAPFAPQERADCLFWIDARTGITEAGGAISAIVDQSPIGDSNRNLTQSTGANKPTLVASDANFDGEPTISFDGGDFMSSVGVWADDGSDPDADPGAAQPFTVFVAFRFSVNDGAYLFDGPNNRVAMTVGSGGNGFLFAGFDTSPLVNTSVDTTYIAAIVFNGASSKVYLNDFSTPAATGNPGTNPFDSLKLGARFTNGNGITGQIGAMGVFDGDLSAGADLATIGDGMKSRFGVT